MPSNNFKPAISSLIPFDELPEIIGQLEEVQDLFDKLYYNNLNVNHSTQGDAGFYSMDLSVIQSQKLALAVPGVDGMRVLLNPSTGGGFPFTLSYKLGILKYIKDFSISSFPHTVPAFLDLLINISGIEETELLSACIFGFIDDEDPIEKFITDYNTEHSPTPALSKGTSSDEDEQINNIISLLGYSNRSVSEVILSDFVNTDNDTTAGLEKLVNLFSAKMGNFSIDDITEMMIPQFTANLGVSSIGVEFPKNIFERQTPNNLQTDPTKSIMTITCPYSIQFDTKNGFEFIEQEENPTIYFPDSYILPNETGSNEDKFIIGFTNAKLDLSRTKNIPEAIADGRPDDFIGVYIQDATIGLPASWLPGSGSTAAIKYNMDDHLGSSNLSVDENGTLVNREEYYPFGETKSYYYR